MKLPGRRTLRRSIAVTASLLALVLAWVGAHSYPSSEAVRLRNALLLDAPSATVGQWKPNEAPADYLAETRPVPTLLVGAARQAAAPHAGELERSRALVAHLLANARDNTPVTEVGIERTYRAIVERGRGYCSDYVDAFVALALAADIPVRTWAFSFDGYGGYGHVVAEIYDRTLKQWVMLDVFNNVHPVDAAGRPLAALDFRRRFAADPATLQFVRIGAGRMPYFRDDKLREYYANGIDHWYLWNGNNVVTRGESAHYRALSAAPGGAQLLAVALGEHPRIVPVPTAGNGAVLEQMHTLRRQVQLAIALVATLALALLLQAALWLRAPPDRTRAVSPARTPPDALRGQNTTT